jgi:hypothetical protein
LVLLGQGCGGGGGAQAPGAGGTGGRGADAAAEAPGAPSGQGGVGGSGGRAENAGAGGTSTGAGGATAAGPDAASGGAAGTPDAVADAPSPDLEPACGTCTTYGQPQLLGRIATSGLIVANLNALSGLAASWRNPGIVYVHNDHAQPNVYAVDEKAAVVAELTIAAGPLIDIEDIAVSRCPAGTCIYVADIGNNVGGGGNRLFKIIRTTEPALPPGGFLNLNGDFMAFRYEGATGHNAESLLIDVLDGTIYIVTKVGAGQPSAVYRLGPYEAGRTGEATKVADLTVPTAGDTPATAGSAHPCGAGFLLRTNNTLYEFRTPRGTPLLEAFKVTPVKVPVGVEQQGEAVDYLPDGRGYYTTSEGAMPPLHRVSCQ